MSGSEWQNGEVGKEEEKSMQVKEGREGDEGVEVKDEKMVSADRE